ncbi:MAG: fibronectin type III domain-containing protein [Actinomycetes bacterium]
MRARFLLLILTLFGSALVAPAYALPATIKSIDAPWVYFYAGDSTGKQLAQDPLPRTFSVDQALIKSTFNVDFTNTPEIYHAAISAAADVWAQNFTSKVPVKVKVLWERQLNSGILAAASPGKFHSNFKNIPDNDLWYASALADAISGEDIEPTIPEITIRINSLNGPMLYLGTDGNCPSNKYDLESMILHEMGHGLGFLSNADYDELYGYGSIQQPTPFDAYAQLPDGRRLMDLDSPSLELGQALTQPLVWSGANAVRANNGIKPLLYTPSVYELGSSVSHLDETTFSNSARDSVMTPNLKFGEVFHLPGPLLIAIFEDLLAKPPAGIPYGIPGAPRNVKALVGDKSAIVTFDPPINQRTAQITSYVIKVNQTGNEKTVMQSPVTISGLTNGSAYSFTVQAKNAVGSSVEATTNGVIPQAAWRKSYLDSTADGKYLATATYKGKTVVAYSDTQRGTLKLATWSGTKWLIKTIDGDGTTGGRTKNSVAGSISLCTNKVGKTKYLNLYYGDLTNKDLRRASFNGKRWNFEVIDGDGPVVQNYKELARVRTASDVSVSNACAITAAGEQVFYRDESQGILLGAVRDGKNWRYEIIDGDSEQNNRTLGDVAFHLKAVTIGNRVNVFYDSVLSVSNTDKSPLLGEVRIASRDSAFPEDWKFQTIQPSSANTIVAGYDVAVNLISKTIYTSWLGTSGISLPKPDQIQWSKVDSIVPPSTSKTDYFGTPSSPTAVDKSAIIFGCQDRLCAYNKKDQTINLISKISVKDAKSAAWITINKIKFALVASSGKLTLFRKP